MIPFVGTIEKVGKEYMVVPDFPERYQLHLAKLKAGTRVNKLSFWSEIRPSIL